jgi:hypothetical protein
VPRQTGVARIGRLIQRFPFSALRFAEVPFVRAHSRRAGEGRVVILLALPRSGSTLAYQALVHALKPIYLTNVWHLFYGLPYLGGLLSRRICCGYQSSFRSERGFVNGLCGPAEGLRFWSYWLGNVLDETRPVDLDARIRVDRADYLRATFSALTRNGDPIVTGYVGHVLHVDELRQLFPEALFIRLHRDPLSNAYSLYRVRRDHPSAWFSVFPRECESVLRRSIHEQVAAQVYWLNRRLNEVAQNEQTIHITYEECCRDPNATIHSVVQSARDRGISLSHRTRLPDAFQPSIVSHGDDADTLRLSELLNQLEEDHGEIRRPTS